MKSRIILKIVTVTSVILLCLGFAISLYLKMSVTERARDFDLYTLVPPNSRIVVDTENMVNLMQRINDLSCSKDNHFLYFSRFFCYLKDHINTLLEHTPHGLSKQMDKMLISFHEPDSDQDQVFYCRLGTGDFEFIEQFIHKYFASSFPSRFFDYRGEEIRIYPMPDDTFLACYVSTDFLAVSYQKRLIEEVIDARLTKKSILSDKSFSKIRAEHRMIAPATIYACLQPVKMGRDNDAFRFQSDLGNWTEFNVNLSGDAIYLSGINYDADTCVTFINTLRTLKPVKNFPGDMLPDSTFFFFRTSVSDLDRVLGFTSRNAYFNTTYSDAITAGDDAVYEFLKEYADDDMIACMFNPNDSLSDTSYTVINIPLSSRSDIKPALADMYRSVPQYQKIEASQEMVYFSASSVYTAYVLPCNTLFAQLTGVIDSTLLTYACIYKDHLLISPHVKGLQAYIESIEDKKTVPKGVSLYNDIIATLSQTYNFLMMADMERVLRQPKSCVRFIPNLFFRYDRFFRHFILTTQFTSVDDVVYPNLILTYKGGEL